MSVLENHRKSNRKVNYRNIARRPPWPSGYERFLLISRSSDPITDFTSSLITISEKCIPKTSTNPKKSNPWYNDDCKEAIKQQKHTLSKFCKFRTHENLNTSRNYRAKARLTINCATRKSWRTYVFSLNYDNFFQDTTHHKQMDDLPTPTDEDGTEDSDTTNSNMDTTSKTPILTEILHDIEEMKTDIIQNEGGFTLMYRGHYC